VTLWAEKLCPAARVGEDGVNTRVNRTQHS